MSTDTKTALLESAEHFARERGFDGFSYADLSEAVGIRKASIHYHFPTKAALSEALMDRYIETLSGMCADIKDSNARASEQLRGLIALYRVALNDGKTLCLCVSLTTSHRSLNADVNDKITEFRSMMIDWIEAVFVLGQADQSIDGVFEPKNEARGCLALLEGAHLAARAEENVTVFDQALQVLHSRLLK